MPRRVTPDPLAHRIGRRIRALRNERGLTLEKLAFESEERSPPSSSGRRHGLSKGHLSSIEAGLVMPTVATLETIAERLDVLVADLVNDPEADDRSAVLELTRGLTPGVLRKLVRDLSSANTARKKAPPTR